MLRNLEFTRTKLKISFLLANDKTKNYLIKMCRDTRKQNTGVMKQKGVIMGGGEV